MRSIFKAIAFSFVLLVLTAGLVRSCERRAAQAARVTRVTERLDSFTLEVRRAGARRLLQIVPTWYLNKEMVLSLSDAQVQHDRVDELRQAGALVVERVAGHLQRRDLLEREDQLALLLAARGILEDEVMLDVAVPARHRLDTLATIITSAAVEDVVQLGRAGSSLEQVRSAERLTRMLAQLAAPGARAEYQRAGDLLRERIEDLEEAVRADGGALSEADPEGAARRYGFAESARELLGREAGVLEVRAEGAGGRTLFVRTAESASEAVEAFLSPPDLRSRLLSLGFSRFAVVGDDGEVVLDIRTGQVVELRESDGPEGAS